MPADEMAALSPVFKATALQSARARAAVARNLDPLFAPGTVAIIGASARPGSVGQAIFANVLQGGYAGTVYPVNPKHRSVLGVRAYARVTDIDDELDLAVIAVPAPGVLDVVEQCAQKGAKAAVVVSAGFKELGSEGAALEKGLADRARESGMALLGPNCLGLINADPAVSLNASFARTRARPGPIAFMSQSGALCTSILDYAQSQNIGFSKFVSFGNKADIDENDLLRYLGQDPHTRVILMYVEDLSDGLEFIHIARRITSEQERCKPILALKSGRTLEGAAAAASHTGSLAGTDEMYDAILAQAGVLRVDAVQELFEYAMAFASQPMPAADRIAIVTNAGGPGIMATDACVRQGLRLAKFSQETRQRLRTALPRAASLKNPVDVLGDACSGRYAAAVEAVLQDENVDGLIAILTPQTMTDIEETAAQIARLSQGAKPVLASFMGGDEVAPGVAILRRHGVPHYPFPEATARALRAMRDYRRWIARPRSEERIFAVDRSRAHAALKKARAEGRLHLSELEALPVLEAYGFPVLRAGLARTPEELEVLAGEIGFPLVLKIASPDILHKTEVGGVAVGVPDLEAARRLFAQMLDRARVARPEARLWGVEVQQQARPGRELILGATRDPRFGPLVMFGLGGIYAEALRDVSFRLAPLRPLSARHMLEQIRGRRILEGVRGQPPVDMEALQECLERLSQLVVEFPVIRELDINPLMAYEKGAAVADARIILEK